MALRVIHGDFAVGKSYEFLVSFSKNEPLFERRSTIGKTFFNKMCHESNCLNYLLPDKRDPQVFEKTRHPTCYPVPFNRTKRYQSFVHFKPVPI